MNINQIYNAECFTLLQSLPDKSINCCVTSPPYYGLRDYGNDAQIGLEKTPEEYIKKLVDVFHEVRRILRDDGTLWVNIGDSYAGSMKGAASYPENAMNYKQGTNRGTLGKATLVKQCTGCKPKDLIGIPWMLAFALRADGWYLRQDIIWSKPSVMPESVKDRCTKSHEYIFLLSKNKKYYFDNYSIAEAATSYDTIIRNRDITKLNNTPGRTKMKGLVRNKKDMNRIQELEAEIQRIKKEEAEGKKAKYQHFVGKYVHRAHTSYEKIVGIDRIDTDEFGDEVVFDSIYVYFDNRGDEYNNDASINLQGWGQAYAEELEKQLISPETFNKALSDCIDLIRRRLA